MNYYLYWSKECPGSLECYRMVESYKLTNINCFLIQALRKKGMSIPRIITKTPSLIIQSYNGEIEIFEGGLAKNKIKEIASKMKFIKDLDSKKKKEEKEDEKIENNENIQGVETSREDINNKILNSLNKNKETIESPNYINMSDTEKYEASILNPSALSMGKKNLSSLTNKVSAQSLGLKMNENGSISLLNN